MEGSEKREVLNKQMKGRKWSRTEGKISNRARKRHGERSDFIKQ